MGFQNAGKVHEARIAAIEPSPIEEKPLIHFHPGSRCLSVGTFGCNFCCKGCQNHELSWGRDELDALAARAREIKSSHIAEQLPASPEFQLYNAFKEY